MRAFLLIAVAAVVVATPASAKELRSATVCGSDGCTTTATDQLRAHPTDGETTVDAPPPAEYYLLELAVAAGERRDESFRMIYVPSEEILAVYAHKPDGLVWLAIGDAEIGAIEDATHGLEPFAGPRAWPTEVRILPPADEADRDWPLVNGSLAVALACGLGAALLSQRPLAA